MIIQEVSNFLEIYFHECLDSLWVGAFFMALAEFSIKILNLMTFFNTGINFLLFVGNFRFHVSFVYTKEKIINTAFWYMRIHKIPYSRLVLTEKRGFVFLSEVWESSQPF